MNTSKNEVIKYLYSEFNEARLQNIKRAKMLIKLLDKDTDKYLIKALERFIGDETRGTTK